MIDKPILSTKHIADKPLKSDPLDETSIGYMLRLAWPMIVTTMSFTMMQFVDRIMVSRLGTVALAAVLPAGFVSLIPAGFAIGVLASVATFVSQSLGRGEKKNCSSYCWQGIYIGLVYFTIAVVIMWPAAPAIFRGLGYSPEVVELEVIYFRIILYANWVAILTWASNEFFIGIHRPTIIMYSAMTAQVVNIIVNYVLIFGKFGFPAMGIAGAGWGTFAGIMVGATLRMIMFLNGDVNAAFGSRKAIKIDFRKMLDLLKVGLPAGLELMQMMALWGAILCWLVSGFGKEAQAATSAVLACVNISTMPIVGLRIAMTAAVGRAIGANRKNSAIKQTRNCLRIAIGYMATIGVCFFIFRNNLIQLWSKDNEVIRIGANILICAAIYQVFNAVQTIYSGSLRGAGDTVWLAVASATGGVSVLGLSGLFMIKFLPQLGPLGPWAAAILSIMTIGSINRRRFKSNKWKQIDLFKRELVVEAVEA